MENDLKQRAMMRALRDFKVTVSKEGFGKSISKGCLVNMHYVGKFTDGTVFDSSYDRHEPKQIHIGVGTAIPAWDLGICGL